MIEAVRNARQRMQFDVWAYVIMPEHVHLLLRPRAPTYDIARILSSIKGPVGRKAITYLEAHAPAFLEKLTLVRSGGACERRFWQAGGGYDRNVVEVTTAQKIIEYIHLNPVRRGLVKRPEDWAWSSAGWYAGQRPVPLEIDSTLPDVYGV